MYLAVLVDVYSVLLLFRVWVLLHSVLTEPMSLKQMQSHLRLEYLQRKQEMIPFEDSSIMFGTFWQILMRLQCLHRLFSDEQCQGLCCISYYL